MLGITSRPPEDAPSNHALQDEAQLGRNPGVRINRPVKRQQITRVTEAFRPIHQRYSVQDVVFPYDHTGMEQTTIHNYRHSED